MGSNQTWIEKADLEVADLTDGGLLVAEQASSFYELLIEESMLLGMCTTIPMGSPQYEVSKMGFTGRVLRGAQEGTALSEADRSKPEFDKVTLSTKEFIAEVRIPYQVVEDNVANGSFPDYAMKLMAKAVSRDMEDVIINGDISSGDAFLAKLDGVLAQVGTLTVNAGGVRLQKSILKTMLQTMPAKFLRSQKGLAFITSKNASIDYIDSLSNRQTARGDAALVAASDGEYAGYPIVPIPLFPETQGSGNKTSVLFCDPKNIQVGIQRDVRVETGRDISAREFIIVATVRFDVKWAHEPAVVMATEVRADAG